MPSRMQKMWVQKKLTTVFGMGQFCDPKYIEMVGLAGGWDGVWLDQEHTGLTIDQICHCTRAARLVGIDCFVRVAPTDYATIMRPFEAGAHGVMAAQIRSVEQAAAVIEWSKFHPQGLRGVNSSGCDGKFGTMPMLQYMKQANEETYIILQVEHFAAVEAVEKANLTFDDVDMLIPHQANMRIIDAAARRLALPREKVWVNLDRYGNTSAASIPIALFEAAEAGKLDEGDNIVLVAFGGGLSWAAGVVRWGVEGVCQDPACRRRPVTQSSTINARRHG